MSEIEGELDREKGSGDVEQGGVLWLQGIMGAGLASSLAGNRILNGCLLAPSHRHTHHPPVSFLPAPILMTPHSVSVTVNFIRPSPACVCVPLEATQGVVLMTLVALISHLLSWHFCCGDSSHHRKMNLSLL